MECFLLIIRRIKSISTHLALIQGSTWCSHQCNKAINDAGTTGLDKNMNHNLKLTPYKNDSEYIMDIHVKHNIIKLLEKWKK